MLGVSFFDLGGASVRACKFISFVAVVLSFLSGCGESRQELLKKANSGDVFAIKELANQGNAEQQYNLGEMYYFGKGVPQDVAEAVKWYRLAADQGNADAQLALGMMYEIDGMGVTRDYAEAAAMTPVL